MVKISPGPLKTNVFYFSVAGPIMKKYRVAFIGAHPDDIERNAGGTVAILSQAGWEVELVSLTSGQKGSQGNPETRMSEFHEAAKMFGVKTVILDFEDTELIDDLASRLSLVAYLRRFRPHLVLMPYPERGAGCIYGNHGHPDHAVTGQITLNALPLANFSKVLPDLPPWHTELALYYLLPLGVVPDVFVPISQPMMDMALAAVDCHISQQGLYRGYGALHQEVG